jgi:hypothetical protein
MEITVTHPERYQDYRDIAIEDLAMENAGLREDLRAIWEVLSVALTQLADGTAREKRLRQRVDELAALARGLREAA